MVKLTDDVLLETVRIFKEEGTTAKTAVRLRLDQGTICRRLNRAKECGLIEMGFFHSANGENKNNSFSRDEFREQFDLEAQTREAIRKAIKELGVDEILRDADFRQERCRIGTITQSWRQIIKEDEFLKNQFFCDKKIWWADSDTVVWACDNIAKARPIL
jgi:hypothetical protein